MTEENRWTKFYEVTKVREPRELFVEGLEFVPDSLPKEATEIGFGAGVEARALIENNWKVTAIDAEEEAAETLRASISDNTNLTIITNTYENVTYPETSFIHAGFSLPFCPPEFFPSVWQQITNSLRSEGIFCGQLFGNNDAWNSNEEMTFHSREDLSDLFTEYEIIKIDEIEGMRKTATGGDKYWHFFNIIAKRN